MSWFRATGVAAIALSLACAGDRDTLATFDGGSVTRAELEGEIRSLPPEQRRPADGDFAKWHAERVAEIAFRKIVLAQAWRDGRADLPEVERAVEEIRKQTIFAGFVARSLPPESPPLESELRERYASRRDEFHRPERRLVTHLFRRLPSGADETAVRAALEVARERILGGERVERLAAGHSDSETRHRGGFVGWVERGQVSPGLERVLFDLEEGTPSQVLRTRDGLHVFVVESVAPERSYSFEDVRSRIALERARERLRERLRSRLGDDLPAGSFVPDPRELRALVQGGEPGSVVARIGEAELRLDELFRRARERPIEAEGRSPFERANEIVEQFEIQERTVLHARGLGLDREPELAAQIARRAEIERFGLLLREALEASIDAEPLARYFDTNRRRYSTPLRLRIRRLAVPPGVRPAERMARLEAWRPDLDAGRRSLEELAEELGGTTTDLGWLTFEQLREESSVLAGLALEAQSGRHTVPYQGEGTLEIARVLDRQEPEPQPLSRVESQVRRDYVGEHGHELLNQQRRRVLDSNRYRYFAERPGHPKLPGG